MAATQIHSVLPPKTQGTLNLAASLPAKLDFFVLLFSIFGITGSRVQANYAEANTFQDSFARGRALRGQHAISLNLGAINFAGYAAEHDLLDDLRHDGLERISKAEFLALLDYACDPANSDAKNPARCQSVTGLAAVET